MTPYSVYVFKKICKPDEVPSDLHLQIKCKPDEVSSSLHFQINM